MSFISYAQNFEDVMLWRALKDINKGFYIDIGAWSPDQDSVTRAFYERGWHGINIEPNPEFIRQLQNRRPHDINLQLAIGDQEETLSMNFLANPGLSTLDDAIAQKHQEAGWEVNREPVQVTTLNNVWADYVPTGQEVHFLKVDVEGFEAAVLRGNDWRKNRPWIIVVESTLPMSQEQSYGDWEPMLLNAGYYYAYFDGLNRFYVAKEHSGLLDSFKAPPNFFDDFVLYRQQEAEAAEERATQAEAKAMAAEERATQAEAKAMAAEERATQAEAKAMAAEERAAQAEAKAMAAEERAAQAEAALRAVYQSRSWRITRPLRELAGLMRRGRDGAKRVAKRLMATSLDLLIRLGTSRPWVKRPALALIRRYPRIEARLRQLAALHGFIDHTSTSAMGANMLLELPHGLENLPPRARQIYAQLKAAIKQKQEEKA